ncbi:DinB family protein [Allokutzneria multivorans]|uniref:DinB family protein n=1 Tax=Allokutzneria multivorans TaxID=1142134 RepID=A0ABP7SJQ4_9PSEU
MPNPTADERTTLENWLDFYRATLVVKCAGLTEQQLRTASAPPSSLTLLGLLQHLAEVERNWFRRVLAGEDAPPIHPRPSESHGHDGGFELAEDATSATARATWEAEVAAARKHCATKELADTGTFGGAEFSLRWIYTHMIAEYARHCGHADLLRERVDGATGL